jgi:hypothetical protein
MAAEFEPAGLELQLTGVPAGTSCLRAVDFAVRLPPILTIRSILPGASLLGGALNGRAISAYAV